MAFQPDLRQNLTINNDITQRLSVAISKIYFRRILQKNAGELGKNKAYQ